jgi:carbamoyltransferase
MKTIWGISALNHDASITVMRGNEILFAGHSERYTRIKNDSHLWFEKTLLKKSRQLLAGQWKEVLSQSPKDYLAEFGLGNLPLTFVPHHMSHAAAGYFTSKFEDAAVVVVDAIGEWDTISVWEGKGNELRKVQSTTYPNSLGLLYSAVTQRVGLKPNEEEYILMGMAAYGSPVYYDALMNDIVECKEAPTFRLKVDLHRGMRWWREDIKSEQDYMNLAASIQKITEEFMCDLSLWAQEKVCSENLVLMGGCALNCVANEKIAQLGRFNDIWIMPNPGDAGSSLGAILAHTKQRANWVHPYLGTNIDRPFDLMGAVDALASGEIIGVATGKAEFGPRALGNRSLLADPRGDTIKDRVNDIKKRQRFRPFAPIVIEDLAHKYFDLPVQTSPYMQFTAKCLYPELFPAICHVDGSSRVQTLNEEQNPTMFKLLKEFYKKTGCPILLNTSLNIKGEPLVNTWEDATAFQNRYKVRMF